MNKQVDAIRTEIERRAEDFNNRGFDMVANELKEVVAFLDTLPDEQPSKDLEEAAMVQANPVLFGGKIVDYLESKYEAFIAGAKWQKEQMLEDEQ